MARSLLLCIILLPALASASVKRQAAPNPEEILFQGTKNGVMAAGSQIAARTLPAGRGFTVTRADAGLNANSGGGAGNTVCTLTDGTNTCTLTWTCAATETGAVKVVSATLAGTAGSGCTFPAGAGVRLASTTAGCTTTQPNFGLMGVYGVWR
jgi:hypothetical protein